MVGGQDLRQICLGVVFSCYRVHGFVQYTLTVTRA